MGIHPFYGRGLHRGNSKCQAGSFKSLLFDSSRKTPQNSNSGIRYGIPSAGSGQAEASRNGQEVVEMMWRWTLTYIRLWTQRSLNVLLTVVKKIKTPQLYLNIHDPLSHLCSAKLRKIWIGFQDIYRFCSGKNLFAGIQGKTLASWSSSHTI
jgi:hypothetical protein